MLSIFIIPSQPTIPVIASDSYLSPNFVFTYKSMDIAVPVLSQLNRTICPVSTEARCLFPRRAQHVGFLLLSTGNARAAWNPWWGVRNGRRSPAAVGMLPAPPSRAAAVGSSQQRPRPRNCHRSCACAGRDSSIHGLRKHFRPCRWENCTRCRPNLCSQCRMSASVGWYLYFPLALCHC